MRNRKKVFIALAVGVAIIAPIGFLMMPVCKLIEPDALINFNVPIQERTDTDFGMAVFQPKDGQWFQCKTRFSRLGFM